MNSDSELDKCFAKENEKTYAEIRQRRLDARNNKAPHSKPSKATSKATTSSKSLNILVDVLHKWRIAANNYANSGPSKQLVWGTKIDQYAKVYQHHISIDLVGVSTSLLQLGRTDPRDVPKHEVDQAHKDITSIIKYRR